MNILSFYYSNRSSRRDREQIEQTDQSVCFIEDQAESDNCNNSDEFNYDEEEEN